MPHLKPHRYECIFFSNCCTVHSHTREHAFLSKGIWNQVNCKLRCKVCGSSLLSGWYVQEESGIKSLNHLFSVDKISTGIIFILSEKINWFSRIFLQESLMRFFLEVAAQKYIKFLWTKFFVPCCSIHFMDYTTRYSLESGPAPSVFLKDENRSMTMTQSWFLVPTSSSFFWVGKAKSL